MAIRAATAISVVSTNGELIDLPTTVYLNGGGSGSGCHQLGSHHHLRLSCCELLGDGGQVAVVHVHPQSIPHEQGERHLLLDAVSGGDAQLVGKVLTEADPRAAVERDELERVVREEPVAVWREPSLRSELEAVVPPHRLHPTRGVNGVGDGGTGGHECAVGEDVVGHDVLGVLGDGRVEPERLGEGCLEVHEATGLLKGERCGEPRAGIVAAGFGEDGGELK
ncbi:hypothetical protein C4D60_Mb04t33470 [Musa balbisiana]|uniref:Uncharacterized protein n=1 Tax=Musa balbisiana TaxID=52838 RepID=A0A4S8KH29_MUSBA|nr:hypothetical protein C4D60_Mb04t33470 [Musa balbisiana]